MASKMDAAALATRKVDAAAFISNAAASKGWQTQWLACFCPNFAKLPFNIGKSF